MFLIVQYTHIFLVGAYFDNLYSFPLFMTDNDFKFYKDLNAFSIL